jgi:hypothetical protein
MKSGYYEYSLMFALDVNKNISFSIILYRLTKQPKLIWPLYRAKKIKFSYLSQDLLLLFELFFRWVFVLYLKKIIVNKYLSQQRAFIKKTNF